MHNEIKNWTASQIPKRNSGLAIITGSTEGIGFEDGGLHGLNAVH